MMKYFIITITIVPFLFSCQPADSLDKCYEKHELEFGLINYACNSDCIDKGGDSQTCYYDCLLTTKLIFEKGVCDK
jgi:hypothetical protein